MKRLAWLPLLLGAAPVAGEPSGPDPYQSVDRLAEAIEQAAAIAREAAPSRAPNGRGEGALHVVRLLLRAIDEELAWADTDFPYFQAQDERFAKLALGNPDNLYLVSRVDDDARYRIHGRRGTTADFAIQLYQGYPGVGRPFDARGSLDLDEIEFAPDGSFEVFVGGPARERNWIELHEDSRRVLVRYTYGDWTKERAGELGIERLGTRGRAGHPPDDATTARRLDATSGYLLDALKGYLQVADHYFASVAVNSVGALRRVGAGGLTGQYSANGRYAIRDDQALIVTTRPSKARYQGLQLGTEWFEALDFTNQVTSLNATQARRSSDGRYHFVISTRDPGVANWLDARGCPHGQLLLRWQGAEELGPEHQPQLELVAFDALRTRLPDDEPVFGPEERRAQIAARQAAIERRYGLAGR